MGPLQIVADGLVLTAQSMELDESTMTGESDQLKKDPKHSPMLLSGTKVRLSQVPSIFGACC
jgi:magnesium-transporting ATPase (P-type)